MSKDKTDSPVINSATGKMYAPQDQNPAEVIMPHAKPTDLFINPMVDPQRLYDPNNDRRAASLITLTMTSRISLHPSEPTFFIILLKLSSAILDRGVSRMMSSKLRSSSCRSSSFRRSKVATSSLAAWRADRVQGYGLPQLWQNEGRA